MEEIFYMKHIHLINSLSLDEQKFTKKRQVNTIQIQNSSFDDRGCTIDNSSW